MCRAKKDGGRRCKRRHGTPEWITTTPSNYVRKLKRHGVDPNEIRPLDREEIEQVARAVRAELAQGKRFEDIPYERRAVLTQTRTPFSKQRTETVGVWISYGDHWSARVEDGQPTGVLREALTAPTTPEERTKHLQALEQLRKDALGDPYFNDTPTRQAVNTSLGMKTSATGRNPKSTSPEMEGNGVAGRKITLRFTAEELQLLWERAMDLHLGVGEYVRRQVLGLDQRAGLHSDGSTRTQERRLQLLCDDEEVPLSYLEEQRTYAYGIGRGLVEREIQRRKSAEYQPAEWSKTRKRMLKERAQATA